MGATRTSANGRVTWRGLGIASSLLLTVVAAVASAAIAYGSMRSDVASNTTRIEATQGDIGVIKVVLVRIAVEQGIDVSDLEKLIGANP